jgi:hypothetical protein
MRTVIAAGFVGSLLGLAAGIGFDVVGGRALLGLHNYTELFGQLARLIGWAAGGIIGAIAGATHAIVQAIRRAEP